jgi:O-antigen/teichoic acid export membrane protein
MDRQEIIRKVLRGGIIVFAATGLQYLIAFGTQIALARMLEPAHFGTLAFATMVAMFFNNFTNIQGDKYIIREKKDIHQKLDNIFTLEILLAIVFIFLVIGIAPILMKLLGKPELTRFVQFLSLLFLYNPYSKPRSLFERKLSFFRAKFPVVIAQLIGGIVGVSLAYFDYGIWSLLWWRFSTMASEVLIIWMITQYRPRLALNRDILKGVVSFGWPLLGSSVLVFFYWNIDYYIVGYLLGEKQLGYYWLAFQVSHYFLQAKTAIISVVFPAFSRMGNEADIKKTFEILTRLTAIVYMFPTIIVLVLGEDLIRFIFGPKWLPATTAFKIFMVLTTLRAVTSYWDPVFWSYSKTRFLFILAILNSVFVAGGGYFATKLCGIEGMSGAVLLSIMMITPIAGFYLKKLINVSYAKILFEPLLIAILLLLIYNFTMTYLLKAEMFSWGAELISTSLFIFSYGLIFYRKNKVRRSPKTGQCVKL